MDDLIAFLEARLAEDQERAYGLATACMLPGKLPDFTACGGPAAEAYWEHFGPARMLADVEARRKILARHAPVRSEGRMMCGTCLGSCTFWPCPDLLDIAAVWSDHPDCLPKWKPQA